MLQVCHRVLHRHTRKVVNLATAQNRGQYFMLFRRSQDKDGMCRRFLQRLQESIESRHRKHVDFVDDKHLVASRLRRNLHLVNQSANIVGRVVRSRIKFVNVQRALFVEGQATFAFIARLAVGQWVQAVDGFGKDARTGSFAHSARAAEQIGMRQFVLRNGIFQRSGQRLLSDNRVERRRTVFSGRNNIFSHE